MKKNKIITILLLLIFTLTSLNPVVGAQGSEPDWGKIGYGVPEQTELYGEPFVPDYTDVGYAGAAGEVHTLTKEQWKEAWNRITRWRDNNGGVWPNYVDVSKYHVGVGKIYKETYDGMHTRWEKYIREHNGRESNIIGIEDKAGNGGGTNQPSNAGSIQKKLMNAVGPFNSFTGFYNLCKGRKYSKYLNNKYSRDNAISRLKNREGLNCVDVSQLGYALAREMGYDVKFQETYCRVDNVGHALLKVKGHELGGAWVIVDLAACISVNSRANLGRHWCGTPHDAHTNWVE